MFNPISTYTRWLHTQWPAGTVEKLPAARDDGSTNVPGLYVVGDLTGIPLLKFSLDTGARVIDTIAHDASFESLRKQGGDEVIDVAIVGGGVAGMSAAREAKKRGLSYVLFEGSEPFSTITNFPKAKPIYTYPAAMQPTGDLQVSAQVKEELVDELMAQVREAELEWREAFVDRIARAGQFLEVQLAKGDPVRARRVVVAIGRSGNFRKLGVPGEERERVYNRLHDPRDYAGEKVLVVGGGDSALETAIALAQNGAQVTLSYRKAEFSRPKPDNVDAIKQLAADPSADVGVESPSSERVSTSSGKWSRLPNAPAGSIQLLMASNVVAIKDRGAIVQTSDGQQLELPNDHVFAMLGRAAPLDFFRKSGVHINGEWRVSSYVTFVLVMLAAVFVYHWKKGGLAFEVNEYFVANNLFPFWVPAWWASLGDAFNNPRNLLGTLKLSTGDPGFYYSFAYCSAVVCFGIARVKRRKTAYVKLQTWTLAVIQVVPLFLLPYIFLPWAGYNGWFDDGAMKSVADSLFPAVNYGHGREYWRAFGLILAWPLFFWNIFTWQPLMGWLVISFIQTFVIIPVIVFFWGKGAYCGWICSCGALAETMGDAHRQKMPHGPFWNRLNMVGQVFLVLAMFLLVTRILSWVWPESWFATAYAAVLDQKGGVGYLNYVWFVDVFWAGILGVGMYWHFSGRVWCRFACPLAALMHIYARFSRFRIFADKKKCISCNVCTTVCHQGIDVMNFANKGQPMEDPECVRCSACVQGCPTGVLTFGQIDKSTGEPLRYDSINASLVQLAEERAK